MKKRLISVLVTLLCVMLGAFGLAACESDPDKNGGGNGVTQTVAVASVTLNKTELTLEIGGEETLTATVAPDNATNKSVTWSSDNPAVATVANGKVSAVAAGTANVTATVGDKSATCSVTVIKRDVTAEQWKQAMESADNFTYDCIMSQPGSTATQTMTIKIDGAKYMQMMNGAMQISVKEETEYYNYVFSDGAWTKSSIDETTYEIYFASATVISYFKDDFASFAYADGKYTAATLDKAAPMNGTFSNVEVTFENGALAGIKFSIKFSIGSGDILEVYEVKEIGTTEITLPTDYTDNTASSRNSVAGKTFVFKDITCQSGDADDSFLEQMKSANSGVTMVFGADGTVIANVPAESTVQKMTYTQNGSTITVVVVEITVNGEAIEFGEQPPIQMSLVNGELVQEATIQNVAYTIIFKQQTAE
ncbi:MAG: Ig-like domain-containing protein [Candidatus Scatosoma sp.]